jgi:predicted DNA-binding transcriptional regulator AlpA
MRATSIIAFAVSFFLALVDPGIGHAFVTAPDTLVFFLVGSAMSAAHIEPLVVSIAQTAAMLSLSRSQVYNLVKRGALPVIKLSENRTGIEVEAIKAYIKQCAKGVGKFPKPKKSAGAEQQHANESAGQA